MKTIFKKISLLLLTLTLFSNVINAQIGPVVSVSELQKNLPEQVNSFLTKFFPNYSIKSIELKTIEKVYNVAMSNGYDLKFNQDGDLREVEAPLNSNIGLDMLKEILPAKTYEFLVLKKLENNVSEFSFNPQKGYKIEVEDIDYCFNPEGEHIRH